MPVLSTQTLQTLQHTASRLTGLPVDYMRDTPIARQRIDREQLKGPIPIASHDDYIGRGSVLRGRIISHEEVEKMLDEALK